ncbi:hypothetical protein OROMI_001006 [Orobanche minor]
MLPVLEQQQWRKFTLSTLWALKNVRYVLLDAFLDVENRRHEFKDGKAADYDPKYEDRVMENVKKNELERRSVALHQHAPTFFFQAHFSSYSPSPDLHILDHSQQPSYP